MLKYIIPRIRTRDLPPMFCVAIVGGLIGGVYGIVHDQITYAISPEYFTKLKFHQFNYADFGLGNRVFASTIGFLATWWVGFIAAWFLARRLIPNQSRQTAFRQIRTGIVCIFACGLSFGILGYILGLWRGADADYSSWLRRSFAERYACRLTAIRAMSHYREEMCRILTRRAGDWLSSRGWPRLVAAFVLILSTVVAFFTSLVLRSFGVENLPARFAIGAVGGYVFFLLAIGIWLLQFSPIEAKALLINDDGTINTPVPGESKFDESLDGVTYESIKQSARQTEGVIALLLLAGLFGFLFLACHFIYHAPWYLGQLLVNSGNIRHRSAPKGDGFDFLVLPLGFSWPCGLLLVIHSATVGLAIQTLNAKNAIVP